MHSRSFQECNMANFTFFGQIRPNTPPGVPPVGDLKNCFSFLRVWGGLIYRLKLFFIIERSIQVCFYGYIRQKRCFYSFSYTFLQEKGPKHKSESIDMSPNVPDLKNLDLAFSHRLESSYQWATLAPFFDIKVTRYRTCISDR